MNETIQNLLELWKNDPYFDPQTRSTVASLSDADSIEAFGKELEFGTGGLRGIMGVGTNRINRYTVRRATAGLATYLRAQGKDPISVVIAYDSRNQSRELAEETALVLCANGISAFLFREIAPTPLLSFAVRALRCDAGVVLTASHNPKEYNGYKVYASDGCQAVPVVAEGISCCMDSITDLRNIVPMSKNEAIEKGLLRYVERELIEAFVAEVLQHASELSRETRESLKVVYTPLHGAGRMPVQLVLGRLGYHLETVAEQEMPDGDFPTVKSPNPENPEALALAVKQAKQKDADLVLGTDPDSDRVGVAVLHHGEYRLLTGNQIGALLANYVLNRKKQTESQPVLVKTVVTNDLGAEIARSHGVEIRETLTGFKYIGEQIGLLEKEQNGSFLMGYEESYGYLIGTHARDKDAVVSSVVICEMTAYYKTQNKTLIDVLEALYAQYGYYRDALDSFTIPGLEGMRKITCLMEHFRANGQRILPNVREVLDYTQGIQGLPKSDVLKFCFENGSWLAVRPSGTEPKIKIYYSVREQDREAAERLLAEYQAIIKKEIEA
ncbi:MAG: phospho-sugar mutase [Clostridia bacterium]|nr:phospho-sugar mutase [Clostridia bacterium]